MNDGDGCLATAFCAIALFFTGMFTVAVVDTLNDRSAELKAIKSEAIERGFAERNQTTGEWQWQEAGDEQP